MKMPKLEKSVHGFNLLGQQILVLPHIPMFMPPHQAQLFLEVTLEGNENIDPLKIYLDNRGNSRDTNFVLVSDPIVLSTLATDAPSPLRSFTGQLYRGWPWDKLGNLNPKLLLVPILTVNVTQAIYFRSIVNTSPLTELTYIAFHTKETDYVAHELRQLPGSEAANPPDFYQILSAELDRVESSSEAVRIRFPGIANTIPNKLTPGNNVSGIADDDHEVTVQTYTELIYDASHLM